MNLLAELTRSTRAATAVEYGLIIGVLFIGIMAGISQFTSATIGLWDYVATTSTDAMNGN